MTGKLSLHLTPDYSQTSPRNGSVWRDKREERDSRDVSGGLKTEVFGASNFASRLSQASAIEADARISNAG